ncbi:hypothetical protein GCM10009662_76870 [Catellatospora coxensis]|uniref:Uncharacterized protein n=1 Tax=Catellatospora coxensis TaxID=310354 RepID=A0A8J3L9B4_9ACTN|nr:hypothetical protein Cco03nite_71200 [Catellatospora coxensis]
MTTSIATSTRPAQAQVGVGAISQRTSTLCNLVRRLAGRQPWTGQAGGVQAPTGTPFSRESGSLAIASDYPRGTDVWAYVAGSWLPAQVIDTDGNSAMVAYRVPGSGTRLVEAVHASYLSRRCDDRRTSSDLSASQRSARPIGAK